MQAYFAQLGLVKTSTVPVSADRQDAALHQLAVLCGRHPPAGWAHCSLLPSDAIEAVPGGAAGGVTCHVEIWESAVGAGAWACGCTRLSRGSCRNWSGL